MYVRFGKRIWDIVIGLIALPFVLLIIAVLAPLIKLEDGGPVFYNAPRVGKDGVDFKMYKLRSMRVNAPDLIMEDGSTYNGADDPRMTKIGAFMRKTSLDEMPQFFNVLLGDMSVVGNRPLPLYEAERLTSDEYIERFMCPSGLTGLWQVEKRGQAGKLSPEQRKQLDIEYARKMSPWFDLKIILRTFTAFIQKENV